MSRRAAPGLGLVPPPTLQTGRLTLRRPDLDDAGPIFRAYAGDLGVVRFLSWRPHANEDETRAFLRSCLDDWAAGTVYCYVVAYTAEPERPLGMIDLHPGRHGVSFGYVLARDRWGRGLMPEALSALADWTLAQPQVWRTYAFCDAENVASARVMEKAGMAFEGVLRRWLAAPNIGPEPRDCRVYARVR